MKIELKRETCIGSATCVGFVPSAFTLDSDGQATLLVEDADGIDRAALDESVANCPTGSIRLVDAD
jgi:ferredoxin